MPDNLPLAVEETEQRSKLARMMRSLGAAFIRYHRGLGKMPWRWKPWLFQLLMANMIVPLFFLDRLEGQVVLGVALFGGATFVVLTALAGFTRILGLAHISWVPMIIWLGLRLPMYPIAGVDGVESAFAVWIRLVIVLDAGSLVLDAANVVRYIRGERDEMVSGLSGDRDSSES